MLKLLVVTSCTGEKKYNPDNQLLQVDFENREAFADRENELSEYMTPAGEIYTGMQHLRLMEGIRELRNKFGQSVVDLYIVSAGYGVIHEDRKVAPYEVTFNTMNGKAITEWSKFLNIHNGLDKLIPQYDLVLFLLGDKYLKAIQLPFESATANQKLVFFASNMSKKMIPDHSPYYFIEVGQEDAKSFSYGLVGLKGYLFKLLAQETVKGKSDLFERVYADPKCIYAFLEKYRKSKQSPAEQLTLFPQEVGESKIEGKNK